MNMSSIDALGFAAAFCTTVSFLPQAIKVIKSGDTSALSLMMYSIFTVGVALWLAYGILRQDPAMITANLITIALSLCILSIKLRNDVFNKKEQQA
jgi:MtN3 and saliva related transmembrane protein